MNEQRPHITFPLETLFDRLENTGFDCSPAARVRAFRLLAALGPLPPEPGRLCGLLAPLFARSAEEQKRFYEIFDRYWEEVSRVEPPDDAPHIPPPPARKLLKKLLWSALGVLLLAVLVYGIREYWPKEDQRGRGMMTDFTLNAPPDLLFREGDTVRCVNTTKPGKWDSSQYKFSWRIERVDGRVDLEGPVDVPVWNFVAPAPDTGALRQIVLDYQHKYNDTLKGSIRYETIYISCAQRPAIPRLTIPSEIDAEKPVRFAVTEKPLPHLRYSWANSDTTFYGPVFMYAVPSEDFGNLTFSVEDTLQPGTCKRDTVIYLNISRTRAYLPLKALQYDEVQPTARFLWPFWLILVASALAAAWFWPRWLRRKAPPAPEKPPAPGSVLPEGWAQASDRPPYYIPFREQKGVLRSAKEQLRFGDALRLRQEGEDAVLDVPDTLRATVDRGGYPDFRFRFRTRPSEYLFLIDEQMPGKHLARLFRQFAENLRGQDVLLEILWYDPAFRRFWGPALPKGVHIDQLRRLFPQHRLVLMGNAHALLDPYSDSTPRLRPGLEAELYGWKERLLLSPQPPASWNWRERLLYRHFGLFPADLRGLLDAAAFVENGLDTEDLPALFEDWQQQQTALRRDEPADTNYRRWRSLRDHETYLQSAAPAAAPDLLRWLCALAVLPNPTWEITLAVSHALGIAVHHDRLLTLSRIPWLQEGNLHPRLRRELLAALSEDDERLARTTLRDELAAVRPLTADSHAAHELEGTLAIQQFLLQPAGAEYRNLIALLLDTGALTRVQEDELDLAVERWDAKAELSDGVTPSHPVTTEKRGIRAWLAERQPAPEEAPPPPPKPFFTKDFWWAAGCTLTALLLSIAALFYNKTVQLQQAFFERNRAFIPELDNLNNIEEGSLQENFFLKEHWEVDSAVVYNNRGVAAGPKILMADIPIDTNDIPSFERALKLRAPNPYPLAYQNALRSWYNRGGFLLAFEADRDSLLLAASHFERAAQLSDTLYRRDRLDARHGRGIAFFYAGERDSAQSIYQQLRGQKFFDTLQIHPNLQTLVDPANAISGKTDTPAPPIKPAQRDTAAATIAAIERSMVLVQSDTFLMGDDKSDQADEKPAHKVFLRNYYMGKTEVTNAQYVAFLNDYRSDKVKSGAFAGQEMIEEHEWGIQFPGQAGAGLYRAQPGYENHPVVYVTWYGAVEFCNWLSQKTGKTYRLPTEAEWEYAARGGRRWKEGLTYSGSNNIDEVAWYNGNSGSTTHAVGGKKANQLGLQDMSGNVWEWCSDWYDEKYYEQFRDKTALNPLGPGTGELAVLRGGSWDNDGSYCRPANRYGNDRGNRNFNVGFRLARAAPAGGQ